MVTGKWETAAGKGGDGREATTPHDHTTTGRGGREGGMEGNWGRVFKKRSDRRDHAWFHRQRSFGFG